MKHNHSKYSASKISENDVDVLYETEVEEDDSLTEYIKFIEGDHCIWVEFKDLEKIVKDARMHFSTVRPTIKRLAKNG